SGSGLVLEDNGGDDLAVATSGPFTFKTSIASGNAFAVTVKTQPSNPTQNCIVSAGSGQAFTNITNIQVTCGNTFTIGGTVSGLVGSGLVLQDNGGDNLNVFGNGQVSFTFGAALSSGAAYAVSILTQPTNPSQTCAVANGAGNATGNVTTVQV